MRAFALVCIGLALTLAVTVEGDFGFVGNATTINDPDGVLNYRFVAFNLSDTEKSVWFTSVRSNVPVGAPNPEIDTLGGFLSYRSLPMAFFGYWDNNISMNPGEIYVEELTEAMATGYTTIIERDALGNVLRSFTLAQATSNISAGVDWEVESGGNSLLHWLNMSTTIEVAPAARFKVEIFWFLSSILGQIDMGDTDVSPRMVESVIRISGYPYLNASNTLSLRAVVAYDTSEFTSYRGRIVGGTGLSQVYVSLAKSYMAPPYPNARLGPSFNTSISEWQSSSGLRNAIANSFVGGLLNGRFGAFWDVQVADITFRPGDPNIIYDPTIGSGTTVASPASPEDDPNSDPSSDSKASTGTISLFSILLPATLTLLGLAL